MNAAYFDELAERLRDDGVPDERVRSTIDELVAYIREAGADPEAEFGPADEFAAQLSGPDEDGERAAAEGVETWVWTADSFNDRDRLNEFGEQGWEVERLDHLGRFVSRRDLRTPQRWEYRRLTVPPGRRKAMLGRLAPDGWEPCGRWLCFEYVKRPKAASVGPAAEIAAPPKTPGRRVFWGRRFYIFVAVYVGILAVLAAVSIAMDVGRSALVGAFIGSLLALAGMAVTALRERRRTR